MKIPFVTALLALSLTACASNRSEQFCEMTKALAALIKSDYPDARIRRQPRAFTASYKTFKMESSSKSDTRGRPITSSYDAVWGDGFILDLHISAKMEYPYDNPPVLNKGCNAYGYVGRLYLNDFQKPVSIMCFIGYKEPEHFRSTVISIINNHCINEHSPKTK
jgi:hypothetical protein